MTVRLANLGLRSLTLASKFIFVIGLAALLQADDLGRYGLVAATCGFLLYATGLEFYTFATRELIRSPDHERAGRVRDQGIFHIIALSAALLGMTLLAMGKVLDSPLVVWLAALLAVELAAQEIGRLVNALGSPLLASVMLFLRSGAWCWVVLGWMLVDPSVRHLDTVFWAWMVGASMAVVLGCMSLHQLDWRTPRGPVAWAWIMRGIRLAAPLLVASLAFRGLFTVDRYWMDHLAGLQAVGAYVLMVGIASAVLSFLDAAVVDIAYPKLVSLFHRQDLDGFKLELSRVSKDVVIFALPMIVLAGLATRPLLGWIGKPQFADQIELLYWLLAAVFAHALSLKSHLSLYARNLDRPLAIAHLAAIGLFGLAALWISNDAPAVTVPQALFAACALSSLIKLVYEHVYREALASQPAVGTEN